MHYYSFNIADYKKDTDYLKPIEHYIYRSLIDRYYLDEKPIPKETQPLLRRLKLESESEVNALSYVLNEFFSLEDDGYHHARIDSEIEKYQANVKKNTENGKKGGRPPKNKPKITQSVNDGLPTESQLKPNQEPSTKNHELITNNQQKDLDGFDVIYKRLKDKLRVSGVIPIGKPVIDEQLRPDIYQFVVWCNSKNMEAYKQDSAVVAFFKKKDVEDRKKYYTPAADLTGRYYNEDNYQKAIPVTKEQAATIEAKHAETLLGLGF